MKLLKSILLLFFIMMVFTGCNTFEAGYNSGPSPSPGYHKQGPPPHAPAHGYRHKHRGNDLEYDHKIGAYVVINIPDTFFANNLYIRMSDNGDWMVTADLGSGWRIAAGNEVPPKLKYSKGKGKGKPNKNKFNKGKSKKKYK